MNKYLKVNPWKIIEDYFVPENHMSSESIFSLGNGRMGQRANFEETYTGEKLQGNYYAGIYYPDKTKVGWWKNGYPEYFAKVINGPNWIGLNITVEGEEVDLAKNKVINFKRVLHMDEGVLEREYEVKLPGGKELKANIRRFISMVDKNTAAISYKIEPLNFSGKITFTSYLDGDVLNKDSNYNEHFWEGVFSENYGDRGFLQVKTKKLHFQVCAAMGCMLYKNGMQQVNNIAELHRDKYLEQKQTLNVESGDSVEFQKYVVIISNIHTHAEELKVKCNEELNNALHKGFDRLHKEHVACWKDKWQNSDIEIKGDNEAQQGIRFNIFHLNQTYTGDDARLNIGPKGFTGEKYGGSTYWDTEAFAFPFFMCTSNANVAKNLLLYRYNQLQKAIENAEKLGFNHGAALFPMVTMNGEECHNEWEITFEEIHRNGAIAYAIYNYVRHTGDIGYVADYGLELLIAVSRFWAQRVNFSNAKNKYVILGVTGPNEYENNVNNNWYTNKIAVWTLLYTMQNCALMKKKHPEKYARLIEKIGFKEEEIAVWQKISSNMYFPVIENTKVFLQQDGYLDKELVDADTINPKQRPINQNWSWDRILRSPFIKQADVLQGIYFFEDEYDLETIKANFDFYEPKTVHESSLSPCVHSIIASKTGDLEKACALYLRTSRLDLDDYNNEVDEGLHITSMAGTWLSIVEGFGGKRVKNDMLAISPKIPEKWESYSFKIIFRNNSLKVKMNKKHLHVQNMDGGAMEMLIYDKKVKLKEGETLKIDL